MDSKKKQDMAARIMIMLIYIQCKCVIVFIKKGIVIYYCKGLIVI